MNSRRVFREIVKISREGSAQKSLLRNVFRALRLFILFLLFSNNSFSQNNLGNQQYDLNDPRNPDCPCHKYQKLADDEYNKLKNNENQQQFASNLNTNNQNNTQNSIQKTGNNFNQAENTGNDNSSQQLKKDFRPDNSNSTVNSSGSSSTSKKKHSGLWIRKKMYRAKQKHSRIRKLKSNYSVCYKW